MFWEGFVVGGCVGAIAATLVWALVLHGIGRALERVAYIFVR